MKAIIEMSDRRGTARRLGWFLLLWLAGVATVATVSFVLRAWIGP
jgi:hypothetical protein